MPIRQKNGLTQSQQGQQSFLVPRDGPWNVFARPDVYGARRAIRLARTLLC
jgi:hypothetical protein